MDHIVINNTKKDKDPRNEAIEDELKFDIIFGLYSGTNDPLPVVKIRLRGDEKQRATTVAGIKCLWDSGTTNIMITRRHTKYC